MKRVIGVLATAVVVALTAGLVTLAWLRDQHHIAPLPFEPRCVASAPDGTVVLTVAQAHWTSIVVGMGVRHEVGVHGATIAMATVYQETGIRNLDYGDRDSLGLFQQRPSQDWGTPEQIMDPWYASARFYAALVEIPGWETGDVNDTAQAVQRSGHPQAYRQHEENARILAEVFSGVVPAGLTCLDERGLPGNPAAFERELEQTFGALPLDSTATSVQITAPSTEHAWAVSSFAVANAGRLGITEVATAGHSWTADQWRLPAWQADSEVTPGTVVVTFR